MEFMPFAVNYGKTMYPVFNMNSDVVVPDEKHLGEKWAFYSIAVADFLIRCLFSKHNVAPPQFDYKLTYFRGYYQFFSKNIVDSRPKDLQPISIKRCVHTYIYVSEHCMYPKEGSDYTLHDANKFDIVDDKYSVSGILSLLFEDFNWEMTIELLFDDNDNVYIRKLRAPEIDYSNRDYVKEAFSLLRSNDSSDYYLLDDYLSALLSVVSTVNGKTVS